MNEELFLETIEAVENSNGYKDWHECKGGSILDIFGETVLWDYIKTATPAMPSLGSSSKEDQLNILYYYAYIFPMLDLK